MTPAFHISNNKDNNKKFCLPRLNFYSHIARRGAGGKAISSRNQAKDASRLCTLLSPGERD